MPDWKAIAMMSFDFEDNPFQWVWEEMDQLQGQYSKLEFVTKGACKLLGDCRPTNICKELKKFQQKDTAALEATNVKLLSHVADLKVELAMKNEEIRQLQEQKKEGLDRIREFIGNAGDVLNKVRVFDNDIKTEVQLSAPKIITILVNFRHKMEATLSEMWKLVSGSQPELSRPPLPFPKGIPLKTKPVEELKTPLPQRPMKELVAEIVKIEIPAAPTKTEKELETPKTKEERHEEAEGAHPGSKLRRRSRVLRRGSGEFR